MMRLDLFLLRQNLKSPLSYLGSSSNYMLIGRQKTASPQKRDDTNTALRTTLSRPSHISAAKIPPLLTPVVSYLYLGVILVVY